MSAGRAHFDALHETGDPWSYRTSEYERHRYRTLLEALPRARYSRVWEPGCSIGELSRLLAVRADTVQAEDWSAPALRTAAAGPPAPGVTWTLRALPEGPEGHDGEFDLVVLSEVLYYLDDEQRAATATTLRRLLAPAGDVVLVHYLGAAEDFTVRGADAAREMQERAGLTALAEHVDRSYHPGFRLDVLRSPT